MRTLAVTALLACLALAGLYFATGGLEPEPTDPTRSDVAASSPDPAPAGPLVDSSETSPLDPDATLRDELSVVLDSWETETPDFAAMEDVLSRLAENVVLYSHGVQSVEGRDWEWGFVSNYDAAMFGMYSRTAQVAHFQCAVHPHELASSPPEAPHSQEVYTIPRDLHLTIEVSESGAIDQVTVKMQRHYNFRDVDMMHSLAETPIVSGWTYTQNREQGGRAVPFMASVNPRGILVVDSDQNPVRHLERPWTGGSSAYSDWWNAGR